MHIPISLTEKGKHVFDRFGKSQDSFDRNWLLNILDDNKATVVQNGES
jgi:hypothetical protein